MEDMDTLARDFWFGPRGKSIPMRSAQLDRRPIDDPSFSSVYGGPAKYKPSSNWNSNVKMSDFDYDAIFNSSATATEARKTNSSSKTWSIPVYDKPVYDKDIFDGLPGLKSKAPSTFRSYNDMFASISSPPPSTMSTNRDSDFDDLLGNLGRNEKTGMENVRSNSAKRSSSSKEFDDLLAGFESGISAASNRPVPESNRGSIPVGVVEQESVSNDPFVVLESNSHHQSSSSGVFSDPVDEINSLGKHRSARAESSSGEGGGFNDLDPLNGLGKPVHSFYPGRDERRKEGSPSRSSTPQSTATGEQKANSSFRYSRSNMEKKLPVDNFQEPPLFDMPNVSAGFPRSFGPAASSPHYFETNPPVDMSPTTSGRQFDDVWLTVSEVPLFTQPTAAPHPSRPPPPAPRQTSRSESGYFSSSSRNKGDEYSSPPNYSQHSYSPKLARPVANDRPVSKFDDPENFTTVRSHNSIDESANLYYGEATNAFSPAAEYAAAMKVAMEKAEAKFRHARGVREREYVKAARNKESVLLEKDDTGRHGRELRDERNHKEDEEREQKRLQREMVRSREIEREKGRQAVERASREARERAAVHARERAAAEARLKSERVAVGKANAEARERAGRVAVQKAQAEARERAAAEAKEIAEKAAAEAKERAAAKAVMTNAEDARLRAERAAVERAAAAAWERAAAEAQEKSETATAKMNQQRNNDDLESFFSTGRAGNSAPKGRANSTDPFFVQQFLNKGVSEAARRTSSSSGASSNMKRASSTTNVVDGLSSIFGAAASSAEFQEVEGETDERRRARLNRNQRTQERAAKALAEVNQRDLQAQMEQEARHRIAEALDIEIKRWAAGKEGNLRALLSTLQYVLWPEFGWQPVSLTDLIIGASVKKVYRKATLCIHPDKVQQKGATLQQKYIAEKVFDLLKEAWNKFNSEELF